MTTNATPPVGLIGEKSVKLASRMVSQKISTTSSGVGRPASCSNSSTRASVMLVVVCRAWNLRLR